ncbi:hypothetical protein FKW77_006040 [Venturia effusa]|uniref:Uncharacterized protein n=1 Tax=Venturia effusa TaxID=50376 RepID=A0A517LQA7_9PEZI|nr:hypothetical protein FKW77_006040 [Venturia effusa]
MEVNSQTGRAHLKRKCTTGTNVVTRASKKTRRTSAKSKLERKDKHGAAIVLSLPNEIVDSIAASMSRTNDIAMMTRVSKTFLASMSKKLYSSSHIAKINNDLMTLALFTRTISTNTVLASQIRDMELGSNERQSFVSKNRAAKFREISRDSTFRHALKRISVTHLFRDFGTTAALFDDFSAILISSLSHLQNLTLYLRTKHGDKDGNMIGDQTVRTQSLDQLVSKQLSGLKTLSVFSTDQCVAVPKFVSSLLQITGLQLYSTNYVIPEYLPTTNITTLEMRTARLSLNTKHLFSSSAFFRGAAKLQTLIIETYYLDDLYRSRPEQVTKLVVFETPRMFCEWNELKANPFLDRLESLHLHCNIISNKARHLDLLIGHPGSWIKLLGTSLKTLCIFGMENFLLGAGIDPALNSTVFGKELSRIRGAHSRLPFLGPIQFKARIVKDNAMAETAIREGFDEIKTICGNIPVELLIEYR